MPGLGGVLGSVRAGAWGGRSSYSGAPSSNTFRKNGSSLRTGINPRQAPDVGEAYAEQAESARRNAERTAASSVSSPKNPYIAPESQGTPPPTSTVGGGTMGLKPDLSERDRLQKEVERAMESSTTGVGGFMRHFQGIGEVQDAKIQALIAKRDWAEKKAYEDAMMARQFDPRYAQYKDSGRRTAEGKVIEVNDQTGEERIATTKVMTTPEGPLAPEFNPYVAREEEVPEYDQEFARLLFTEKANKEAEERKTAAEKDIATHKGNIESGHIKDRGAQGIAEVNARHAVNIKEIEAREAAEKRVTDYQEEKLRQRGLSADQAGDFVGKARAAMPNTDSYGNPIPMKDWEAAFNKQIDTMLGAVDRVRGAGGGAAPGQGAPGGPGGKAPVEPPAKRFYNRKDKKYWVWTGNGGPDVEDPKNWTVDPDQSAMGKGR